MRKRHPFLQAFLRGIFIGILGVCLMILFIPDVQDICREYVSHLVHGAELWVENTPLKDLDTLSVTSRTLFQNEEVKDSGITGEDVVIDADMNPYYALLSEDEKKLYAQMVANAYSCEEDFSPVVSVNQEQLDVVFQSVFYDNPELFWLDTSYSFGYLDDGNIVQVNLKYNDTINDIEQNRASFDATVNQIVRDAMSYGSAGERVRYVHDALVAKLSYNIDAPYNQSAYSAIVLNETVCAGYAKSLQVILRRLGIPAYYVVGESESQQHAWNIVYMNGRFLNIDATWDDTSEDWYRFYGLSDEALSQTHIRTGLSVQLPACA